MEPCAPLASPLHLTPARFGRVPRYYVECTEDKALPLDIQRAMQKTLPVSQVFSLASSHASMFSHPVELANCLATVANK
ncbi:MAG: hypothetical protein JKY56_07930 [Kofleriaceae bacterium]|nr:hypothetical protein [Kofleriaceae bacterium]